MTKYLITFPASAMQVPDEEMAAVGVASRAVIADAQRAGVYVFAGGLDETVPPVRVAADGSRARTGYPEHAGLSGGFAVLDLPSRASALAWAAKLAAACRCDQEVREFMDDPLS